MSVKRHKTPLTCQNCGKENSVRIGRKCCSRDCQYTLLTGIKHSKEWVSKVANSNRGKKRTLEQKKRMGLSHIGKPIKSTQGFQKGHDVGVRFQKGHIPKTKGRSNKIERICPTCNRKFLSRPSTLQIYCSKRCIISSRKGIKRPEYSGQRHPNWRGGVSRDKHSISNPEYKEWRNQVFQRDYWKCRIGNPDCKGQLQVHHILPWRDYKELRYDVNNGITLCQAHHPRKRAEEKRLASEFQKLVTVSNELLFNS